MQQPAGLVLRADIWHIQKTIRVGDRSRRLRESTGCSTQEGDKAIAVRDRRLAEVTAELLAEPTLIEHRFTEAAAEYVVSLERRSKDSSRAIQDLKLVLPTIGDLPLSHVHQGALVPFEAAQRGIRESGTIARCYRTVVAVLNYAARVLRDGNRPWLAHAVLKITPPDWQDARQPYWLTWQEQDALFEALPAHLQCPALFAVATGAREQEILSLR